MSQKSENSELLDIAYKADKLMRSVLDKFNDRKLKLFDLRAHQRIFLFIITRSLKTYSSILILCEKGYGQDVSTLIRSLLENLITSKYILNDTDTAESKAARFVAYKWIIFKRHLPEQEKTLRHAPQSAKDEFNEKKQMILNQVDDFKKKFNITSDRALMTWSGKSVKDMAREVDQSLVEEYETTFRLCSRFSHPSILGDKEYLIQDDKNLIFSPLPSNIGIIANLKTAIRFILNFLNLINEQFKFDVKEQINILTQEYEQVIILPEYQNDTLSNRSDKKSTSSVKESTIIFKTRNS